MTVSFAPSPFIVSGATTMSLGPLVQVTGGGGNPAYVVLNAFDRAEYTAGASGVTGAFAGNGRTLGLTTTIGDARENGIVFTYQSATGRYYSSTYGYLDQLAFTTSASAGDVTDLSLFGFNSRTQAAAYASDAYSLMSVDPGGFLGSTTIATLPGFSSAVPSQATPNAIAAIADSFVGRPWNMDGCWVLTSTIAAEAGAALPIQSTADMIGQGNGEWMVAFNGPAGASGDWQSMVQTGDMVGFITGQGGGHITTCVAGSGSTAQLVDNMTIVDQNGRVLNAAGDGSSSDITILSPHAAAEEWAGVDGSSVVIYRLDTPRVTAQSGALTFQSGGGENLGNALSISDPAGRAITEVQAYLANSTDRLLASGTEVAATSAATAATVTDLSQLVVDIGSGSDTAMVRAFNGAYWGDWTSITLTGSATAPAAVPTAPAPLGSSVSPSTPGGLATEPVYRFFEASDGSHFYTTSVAERNALITSRSDLVYEGVGMDALPSASGDPAAEPVYRFFDGASGTHFFTASAAEKDALVANDKAMSYEGVAFYEDANGQSGDVAVYRFFETSNGTHLFTDSAAERTSILATRPDLVPEGVAFYAPS